MENQPTYKRQRFLLAFIRQLNRDVSATDLQKLVFLYTMAENSNYYEFIPYRFGSYSFQLKEDLEILQRDGFLTLVHTRNSTRIKAIEDFPKEISFKIAPERGYALIRRAYQEYPYYTINSEITEKVFAREELDPFRDIQPTYTKTQQILFTIGYEGKSIEAFINNLIQNDIRLLCDVRKNPLSRKFGFSKQKLEHITQMVGIRYIHMPDLGIESEKRRSLDSIHDYQNLFADYKKSLINHSALLEELYTLLCNNTRTRIALMCFEREPQSVIDML